MSRRQRQAALTLASALLLMAAIRTQHAYGAKIYWSNSEGIHRANVDGSQRELVIRSSESPTNLRVDAQNNYIYWLDRVGGFEDTGIWRADLAGQNAELLVNGNGGFDIDPKRNKLAWAAQLSESAMQSCDGVVAEYSFLTLQVFEAELDGSNAREVRRHTPTWHEDGCFYDTNMVLFLPLRVAIAGDGIYISAYKLIDPASSTVFVTGPDFNYSPNLESTDHDGTPFALAHGGMSDRILFSTVGPNEFRIVEGTLDGSNQRNAVLDMDEIGEIFVDEQNEHLYWYRHDGTGATSRSTYRSDLSGQNVEILFTLPWPQYGDGWTISPAIVPEPATIVLISIAAIGVVLGRFGRRAN